MVYGTQQTVTWHKDDLKSSHKDPTVNDEFLHWLKMKYASDEIGEVKAVQGKKHDYFGMVLDFLIPGVLKADMRDYVKSMIEEFPEKISGTNCP